MGKAASFDASGVTKKQLNLGKQVAKFNRGLNQVSQTTPTGSLTYNKKGNKVKVNYSPQQQALLNAQTGAGTAAASAAGGIVDANQGAWATGPDLGPMADETGITSQIMDWGRQYLKPGQDQERAALESRLTNQGIAPGSAAWQEAINLNDRGNNDAMIKLLLEGQDTALAAGQQNMDRGLSAYNAPLSAFSTLSSGSQPAGASFAQTPQTGGAAAPDYTGAATTQYQGEQQAQQNQLSNLFRIPSTVLGGWASGGFA